MDIKGLKLNISFNYLVILAMLIALGVAGRLLPHPPNFTPMAAIGVKLGGCGNSLPATPNAISTAKITK